MSMDSSDNDDSRHTSTTASSSVPKVYRKLVDYSTQRASVGKLKADPAVDKAILTTCSLHTSASHKRHHKNKHDPLSCTSRSHVDCKERRKFLTKNASTVSILDSSATFGPKAAKTRKSRRHSSNGRLVQCSLSQHFARATRYLDLSETDEEDITPTESLSFSAQDSLDLSALHLSQSQHSPKSPKLESTASTEKERQAILERRNKMNWLANNACKKDLMEVPRQPPKVLKVIYPTGEDMDSSCSSHHDHHEEKEQLEEEKRGNDDDEDDDDEMIQLLPLPLCLLQQVDNRQPMMDRSTSLRNIAAGQGESKGGMLRVTTARRRSSTSFVAGSRIRKFNVYR